MASSADKVASFAKRGWADKLGKATFSKGVAEAAFDKAVDAITPKVRTFLLNNFDKKGMGHHSKPSKSPSTYVHGSLRKAVGNAVVTLNRKGDGITIKFPPGLNNELYLIANSLNYGWTPGKKSNTGQKQIAVAKGSVGSNRRSTRRKSYAKHVSGFDYFDLDTAQEAIVAKLFGEVFESELASKINSIFGNVA